MGIKEMELVVREMGNRGGIKDKEGEIKKGGGRESGEGKGWSERHTDTVGRQTDGQSDTGICNVLQTDRLMILKDAGRCVCLVLV